MTRSNACNSRSVGSSDEPRGGSPELPPHSTYPPRRWRPPSTKGGSPPDGVRSAGLCPAFSRQQNRAHARPVLNFSTGATRSRVVEGTTGHRGHGMQQHSCWRSSSAAYHAALVLRHSHFAAPPAATRPTHYDSESGPDVPARNPRPES